MTEEKKEILLSPWSAEADETLKALEVKEDEGLSKSDVRERRNEYGRNKLKEAEQRSAWEILIDQFNSVIIYVLLAASVLSFSFGKNIEAFAVLAVVIVNAIIGFITEYRAVKSMESLQKLTRVKTKVRRGGDSKVVTADKLVPGDIVILEGGDVVSADIRLIESNKLQADESPLTGESVPVAKNIDALDKETELAERKNMVFKGTAITKGSGEGVVVSTGMNTEIGNISSLVEEAEDEVTPLEKRLDKLGRKLIWLTLALAAAVGVIGYLRGKEALLVIETAVALAIAAIPEGLPIVATVALARGIMVMAERNTLINRLASVETLGATSVLWVDKTGTLTENKMTVTKYLLGDAEYTVTGEGFATEGEFKKDGESVDPKNEEVLESALLSGVLCNNGSLPKSDDADTIGDPLEVALLVAGAKNGFERDSMLEEYPEEREVAFDADTMMMATFHKKDGEYLVAIKGAPERVIESADNITTGDGSKEITDDDREKWKRKNQQLAEDGLRVLALAKRTASSTDEDPYEGMTFLGLAGLLDPARSGVKKAVADCSNAGIELVMITGDHPATARNIALELDIVSEGESEAVKGSELKDPDEMSDDEKQRLAGKRIYARVTPKQKLDLIALEQDRGSIVAMTGDGVNDAPALKKADIGIAMGLRGTQVAKDASDMILQDDALSSIVAAIEQGRTIFKNIRKFVLYLLSGNMGEILAVAAAFLATAALPLYPLMILFLNFGIDVFPALAVGMSDGEEGAMKRPPRDPSEPILTRKGWAFIWVFGTVIAGSILGAFTLSQTMLGASGEGAVTIAFLTLGLSRLWHVFNMRGADTGFFVNEVTKNKFVWMALALCFVLLFAALYLPGLSDVLRTQPPGAEGWIMVLAFSLVPLAVGQTLKVFGIKLQ